MKLFSNKTILLINFCIPAMLLNSIGVVILMLHSQGVAIGHTGWLQPFKDGSVLISSLLLISYITRYGYEFSIRIGCLIQFGACILLGFYPNLRSAYIFFIMAGISFALLKISIYSSVVFITDDPDSHVSMISLLEGGFMIAIFIANGLFAWMISRGSWNETFFIFAFFIFIAFLASFKLNIRGSRGNKHIKNYNKLIKLLTKPLTWIFLLLIISYPFVEQGFIDFLPTFQFSVLNLSRSNSVLIASMLPAMLAIGRIIYSFIVQYISAIFMLFTSVFLAIITISIALMCAKYAHESKILRIASISLLPVVGLFIAPIYPTLNSTMLSYESKDNQASMTLMIIVLSAIGASTGSVLTGYLFECVGGIMAFVVYILMLIIILVLLIPFFSLVELKRK